jgi:hypothetical protein
MSIYHMLWPSCSRQQTFQLPRDREKLRLERRTKNAFVYPLAGTLLRSKLELVDFDEINSFFFQKNIYTFGWKMPAFVLSRILFCQIIFESA